VSDGRFSGPTTVCDRVTVPIIVTICLLKLTGQPSHPSISYLHQYPRFSFLGNFLVRMAPRLSRTNCRLFLFWRSLVFFVIEISYLRGRLVTITITTFCLLPSGLLRFLSPTYGLLTSHSTYPRYWYSAGLCLSRLLASTPKFN
jgi:hypothetical protein